MILDIVPLINSVDVVYSQHIGYLIAIEDSQSEFLLQTQEQIPPNNTFLHEQYIDEDKEHNEDEMQSQFEFVYKQDNKCYYKHPIVKGKYE